MQILGYYWPQAAADDGDGGAGAPSDRKRVIDQRLEERYTPVEVREVLARYNNDPAVALENVIKKNNDLIKRLMASEEGLKFDLAAAQQQVEDVKAQVAAVTKERDEIKGELEKVQQGERQARIDQLLKARFNDDALVRQHKAYLKLAGYEIELDGDNLMLVAGDKRHRFETVVNDKFYEAYPEIKPASDNPLPQGGAGAPTGGTGVDFADLAAKHYGEKEKHTQELFGGIKPK